MKIDGNKLEAEAGMALKRKDDSATMSTVTSVSLSASDSPDNWEDCEYGDPNDTTKYSVRSIIRKLKEIGKFDAIRQLLEAAKFDWEFLGSNYLAANDADFQRMLSAAVERGILTRSEIESMLPNCIWGAE